jgi:hypothetical protein
MRLSIVVLAACSSSPTRPADPGPTPGSGAEDTVPATARPAGECDDAPLLTLEALQRGERAGERIALEVVPRPSIACTAMACSRECCNRCGGEYGAEIANELRVRFTGIPGTCGGWDCNLQCEPFGLEPKTAYRFVGMNTFKPRGANGAVFDKSEFAVEKYCRVGEPAR